MFDCSFKLWSPSVLRFLNLSVPFRSLGRPWAVLWTLLCQSGPVDKNAAKKRFQQKKESNGSLSETMCCTRFVIFGKKTCWECWLTSRISALFHGFVDHLTLDPVQPAVETPFLFSEPSLKKCRLRLHVGNMFDTFLAPSSICLMYFSTARFWCQKGSSSSST